MIKFFLQVVLVVAVIFLMGTYPTLAVSFTAISIVSLFLLFGKE